MKTRILLLILLLLVISGNLSALGGGLTANILVQCIYFEELVKNEGILLGSLLYTSISCGVGYHFNVIPGILAPGIYGEAGGSFLTMLLNHKSSDEASEENINYGFFFVGIRAYNQFRFNSLFMQPFAGLRLFHEAGGYESKTAVCMNFGIQLEYKMICIEYALNIHLKNPSERVHSIGIGYSFSNNEIKRKDRRLSEE